MMLNLKAALITLTLSFSEGFLFKKKISDSTFLTPTGTAFQNATDACCACFRSKAKLPENAGFIETFAPKFSCQKCYVSDKYHTDAKEETKSSDLPYETTSSAVEEIHEWNWNCGDGMPSENVEDWKAGPVEGEPASGARLGYLMCQEESGYYCAATGAGGALERSPGADSEAKEVDGADGRESQVSTAELPKIGA